MTPQEREMQRRLFGKQMMRPAQLPDDAVERTLCALRTAAELRPFRIWLVGSRVRPGMTGSDIDLVLSPRTEAQLEDGLVEQALWHCRNFGLYEAAQACVIDPCFRAGGPTLAFAPLQEGCTIDTVKLLSPRLATLVAAGRLRACRRVGSVSLEFRRQAGDTDYFAKLPSATFNGSSCRYLRPAIEVASGDHDDFRNARRAARSWPGLVT